MAFGGIILEAIAVEHSDMAPRIAISLACCRTWASTETLVWQRPRACVTLLGQRERGFRPMSWHSRSVLGGDVPSTNIHRRTRVRLNRALITQFLKGYHSQPQGSLLMQARGMRPVMRSLSVRVSTLLWRR
jgi:hypothetical protein